MEAAQEDTSTAYSGKHSKAVQSLAMLQSLHPSTLEITSWAARCCSDIKSCRSSEVRSLEAPSAPFDKDISTVHTGGDPANETDMQTADYIKLVTLRRNKTTVHNLCT